MYSRVSYDSHIKTDYFLKQHCPVGLCEGDGLYQDSFHQQMHRFIKQIKCQNVQLKYLFVCSYMFRSMYCVPCSVWPSVAHYTARSTHITAWNTCCHNAACHITMYFYWSIPQYYSFSKAQHMLPEDDPIGPKYVGANRDILNVRLTFCVFNKRVHLLVNGILMLSKCTVQQ